MQNAMHIFHLNTGQSTQPMTLTTKLESRDPPLRNKQRLQEPGEQDACRPIVAVLHLNIATGVPPLQPGHELLFVRIR